MHCSVFDDHFINIINRAIASIKHDYPVSDFTIPNTNTKSNTTEVKITTLINKHNIARELNVLFPGLFQPSITSTNILPRLKDKLFLKYQKIYFELNSNNQLLLNTFIFDPVLLHIRLARYFQQEKSNPTFNFTKQNINKWPLSIDANWLADKLSNGYSYGRLLDLADSEYDKFKQTGIDPFIFRKFFFAFLSDLDELGNKAFDNYMKTRDSSSSWHKSIEAGLTVSCNFSSEESKALTKQLFILT